MKILRALYEQRCRDGLLDRDPAQEAVIPSLDLLRQALVTHHSQRGAFLSWIWPRRLPPQGLYLWGGVGRGKTFLMDFFKESLTHIPHRRLHFHAFMQEVHQRLFTLRKAYPDKDVFEILSQELHQQGTVLCLDEFFVSHIGDAMILSRLFTALFYEGMVLVTTSNTPPEELYAQGLQRELFLPFIELLLKKVRVVNLQGEKDYRKNFPLEEKTYLTPLGPETEKSLHALWHRLTEGATFQPRVLTLKGDRTLTLTRTAKGVCWISFEALCGQPLGVADYLSVLETFSFLILSDIPDLTRDQFNEARRFITLVDLLYEHRFLTVFSADVPLSHLYRHGKGAVDFRRTRSRLAEMSSWKI